MASGNQCSDLFYCCSCMQYINMKQVKAHRIHHVCRIGGGSEMSGSYSKCSTESCVSNWLSIRMAVFGFTVWDCSNRRRHRSSPSVLATSRSTCCR